METDFYFITDYFARHQTSLANMGNKRVYAHLLTTLRDGPCSGCYNRGPLTWLFFKIVFMTFVEAAHTVTLQVDCNKTESKGFQLTENVSF